MHISEVTVKRPVFATVISLFLVLVGIVSYDKLTIREYPDIDKPVVTVTTVYRGASAEIIERDITQVLEDSLAGISDIKEIKGKQANVTIKKDGPIREAHIVDRNREKKLKDITKNISIKKEPMEN